MANVTANIDVDIELWRTAKYGNEIIRAGVTCSSHIREIKKLQDKDRRYIRRKAWCSRARGSHHRYF